MLFGCHLVRTDCKLLYSSILFEIFPWEYFLEFFYYGFLRYMQLSLGRFCPEKSRLNQIYYKLSLNCCSRSRSLLILFHGGILGSYFYHTMPCRQQYAIEYRLYNKQYSLSDSVCRFQLRHPQLHLPCICSVRSYNC